MENKCKICGNAENNEELVVKENQFGTGKKFTYFKCADCGCLQITDFPKEMSQYYPNDKYYSYNMKTKKNAKIKKIIKTFLRYCYFHNFIPKNFRYFKVFPFLKAFEGLRITASSAILDVGCGSGSLLKQMTYCGYKNLTGIDPFNDKDIVTNDFSIFKTDICNYQPDKKFDVVMFNHSFEHIAEQHETLAAAHNLLTDTGYLIIRIPVCDCFAYRKYGVNWRAWDAPRHFFLHSTNSIAGLTKKHNFILVKQFCDSSEGQFTESEDIEKYAFRYQHTLLSKKRSKLLHQQAEILNEMYDGDTACFILKKQ
ncbi:putative methyltransferase [Bacteroidia bacterium]|nr:putative methyltransferase [Bacteroidia bacterium]